MPGDRRRRRGTRAATRATRASMLGSRMRSTGGLDPRRSASRASPRARRTRRPRARSRRRRRPAWPRARRCGRCRAAPCPYRRPAGRRARRRPSTLRLWFVIPPPSTSTRASRPGQTRSDRLLEARHARIRSPRGSKSGSSATTPATHSPKISTATSAPTSCSGGQVRVRDRLLDGVAVAAARDAADERVADAHRLGAERDRARIASVRQRSRRSGSRRRDERSAADEVALVELHREAEPRLEGRVLGRDVRAPDAVALLEPQRVDRLVAAGDEPVLAAGLPERVPERDRRTRSRSRAPSRARRRTSRAAPGTEPRPTAMWRARMYGNASFESPSSSAAARISRAFGPQSPKHANADVTSATETGRPRARAAGSTRGRAGRRRCR